jgi:hypothetical protein
MPLRMARTPAVAAGAVMTKVRTFLNPLPLEDRLAGAAVTTAVASCRS